MGSDSLSQVQTQKQSYQSLFQRLRVIVLIVEFQGLATFSFCEIVLSCVIVFEEVIFLKYRSYN